MRERSTHLQGELYGPQGQATIDKLTDDSLLEIFDFYLKKDEDTDLDEWYTLVHVCQRWRNIVFASPHRLDLRLLCRRNRPVRATLDIWPVLPLEIEYHYRTWEVRDDIIAALEHHDRVRKISLRAVSNSVWETLVTALQMPFPELTSLSLWPGSGDRRDISVPVLPNSFLGGSAPRLQILSLGGIPFPAVQNLLLSASDLVDLNLLCLPHSGYISPASMVACLSSLNRLKSFRLGFESPLSRPDQPSPPPQTRVVLPALRYLAFWGMADYSEHLLARIDTPVLYKLYMGFFINPIFDIPHFKQFIGRAKGLNPLKEAKLWFNSKSWTVGLQLDQLPGPRLEVGCNRMDRRQLGSMARVCGQLSPFFSSIERFDLVWSDMFCGPEGIYDLESTQFLEILQPFTAIRSLYVCKTLVSYIGPALQELIGESTTEVLPNLRDLFLGGSAISGSIQKGIQAFIEARRLSGQPVTVHHWGEQTVFFGSIIVRLGVQNPMGHFSVVFYMTE
ncbi:hypothetical protein BC826DRAFT_120765 [Russula brevipes]|nr:hypothetical protein BC826DRAFT_120765 [Russula brevipes]